MVRHASSTTVSSLDTHGTENKAKTTAFTRYAEERNALLDAYFRDTKLLDVVHACVANLALVYKTQHALPANPYPSLLSEIRQAEVERAMAKAPSATCTKQPQLLVHEQQTTPQSRLCSTQELLALSVWGSQRVLETANVPQLARTIRRLQNLYPAWFRDLGESQDDDGCKVTIHSALEGNCIDFALLDHPIVGIERHVLISGEYLEKAMATFARQLQKYLHELSSGSMSATTEPMARHVGCTGICIKAKPAPETNAHNDDTNWSLARIAANRNAFVSAVKSALVGQGSIEITTWDLVAAISGTNTEDGKSQDTAMLLQTTQRFFFHFAPTGGTATSAKSSTKKQQPLVNCMFPSGQSRVSERGVFLSEQGALELSTRLQQQQQESSSNEPSNSGSDADPHIVLNNLVLEIKKAAASNPPQSSAESWRQWMETFIDSYAFTILRVVLRNRVLLRVVHFADLNLADNVVEAHFAATNSLMQPLLEQARVGARSSLLTSVEAVLRTRWRELQGQMRQDPQGDMESDLALDATVFADALTCVNELLLLVARAAAADFTRFLHRSQGSTFVGQHAGKMETEEQVDVIVALQNAIENREYPPLVVFEAVFAQYIVDSCVDVALESAVMNIVAFRLPPNPFVELSQRVCAFAIRQHVPRLPLRAVALTTIATTVVDDLVSMARSDNTSARPIFSGNSRLLEILDADKLWNTHQWLTDNRVIHENNDFQPSKRSYSLQTFHSFLVFHPIAHHASTLGVLPSPITAFHPLVEELEVVEHIVVEGKEFTQALDFFAAAVVNDLKRLTAAAAANVIAPSEVTILDPNGKRISDVEIVDSEDAMRIQQLVQEATSATCVLRIHSVYCNPTDKKIVVTGKSYLFHFRPIASSSEQQQKHCCVSPLFAFRLLRFGVFFSLQHAQFVLLRLLETKGVNIPGDNDNNNFPNHAPREYWTPYARGAIDHNDQLLQYELDCALSTNSTVAADQEFRRHLVAQSCLLPLFSIEATCALALIQLGREINKTRKREPSISTLRGIDSLVTSSFSQAFASFAPMLVDQLQRVLKPLNDDMKYVEVDEVAGRIAELRRLTNGDDTKRFHQTLRRAWLLVLYVRFSYQRDFFAHLHQRER